TTIIALLALLAPEERRASILNFSLLPSQLSWFVGPITGAGLAVIALRLPFAAASVAAAVALVLALVVGRSAARTTMPSRVGYRLVLAPVAVLGMATRAPFFSASC